MRSVEASGRTVEEAVERAVRELGVERARVEVEVLEEPSRGFLGVFGQRPARVRVTYRPSKAEAAVEFVMGVCRRLGLDARCEVREEDGALRVELTGPGLATLIGRRGRTLDALQYLADVSATRQSGDRRPLVVDADGYRRQQEERLRRLALRMAERARRTGRAVVLRPMPARERRIVHLALRDLPGVRTESVGEEPLRKVVIRPEAGGRG